MEKLSRKTYIMYLSIPILLYCFVVVVPVLGAIQYSLFEWSGGPNKTFIGINNFVTLIQDQLFWKSFFHNIILTCLCVVGQIGLALILALILNSKSIKAKQFHLSVAYFPVILSAVVVGFIWQLIYDYNSGLLNELLRLVGLENWVQPWLANSNLALFLVAIPLIWKNIGYYMIIILAGLAAIDTSVLEMAEIDGTNSLQRLIKIVIPLMRNTLIVCITLCISGNMKIFDHIYVMTGGGPGNATNVMALYAYQTSFLKYKMGYGSAISIGILLLSVGITLFVRFVTSRSTQND